MIDKSKIVKYDAEMAVHANGAAQFFDALIGGKFVKREQARELADYVLAPMYNKNQPRTCPNGTQRLREGINLWGVVKEIRDNEIIFYDGWNPQERGTLIMNKFFVKKQ